MKKFLLKHKLFWIIPLGLIILLGIFDKLIMPFYISGERLEVPNVVGLHKIDAAEKIEAAGFEPVIQDPTFNTEQLKNHIYFQYPKATHKVKEGRRIYLSVSNGKERVKMPSLLGKSERDAKITLQRIGLKLAEIREVESETPKGLVISQSISPGQPVIDGDKLILDISIGPKLGQIRVPKIIGKSLKDAEKILTQASLKLGEISSVDEPSLLPNTVIIQYPEEGELLNVGDQVDCVVSK